MIPATFVGSSDCGMSECLMLADENFNSSNSIDILLGHNVFLEVRRHNKKTRFRNCSAQQGRYFIRA